MAKKEVFVGATVSMRLAPATREALEKEAAAAGMSIGEFTRNLVCEGLGTATVPRKRRDVPALDAALVREAIGAVNRVGNNINQISKVLKRTQFTGSRDKAAEHIAEMQKPWLSAIESLQAALKVRVEP
jgi:hypothetical protein